MIASPPRGLFLLGVEPDQDCAGGDTFASRRNQVDFVVSASSFTSPWLRQNADVLLPTGTSFETSGTFVNVEARWQSFAAVARPVGEARPAWKVLRVLANRLGVPDSSYNSSDAVRDELRQQLGDITADNLTLADLDIPMYQIDGLVRRAGSLQLTVDGLASDARAAERRRA
jgi:NADH-quinone oxidoreductase subunit G